MEGNGVKLTSIITLNGGRYVTFVDDERYEYLFKFKWYLDPKGYAYRYIGPLQKGDTIRMHREVMSVSDASIDVDHIDRNKLNNQKYNLRLATRSQNKQNMSAVNNIGTSKYRGVGWKKDKKKWQARGRINYKYIFIGYYDSEKEAYEAVCEWRKVNMPFSEEARANAT